MAKSNLTEIRPTNDYTKLIHCPDKNPSDSALSAIVELVQPNKKTISQDKLFICDNNSQKQKLSKISDLDLTTNAKVLKPYWNDYSKEIVSHLSWLTEIGFVDSDLNSLSFWSNKTVEKSWFSTKLIQAQNKNWFKTFCQLYMSFHAESTALEDTITISKKIRILPSPQQKVILRQWLGTYRYVYNHTLYLIQKQSKTPSWLKIKTDIINSLPDWARSVPYQIKSLAIKEAINNLKQQKKQAYLNHTKFKMKFKSKKQPQQSCYIPKSAIKNSGIYPRILKKLKYTEKLPEIIQDSRLVMAYGKFYLTIPTQRSRSISENQGKIVAIDPGIRKFITFVSHNQAGHLAQHDVGRIYRLCHYLDDLVSRRAKATANRKRSLTKAANRIREKIKNLIDELHWKVARFLVNNYDLILLPTFETSKMANKAKRKIRSKSVRAMMTFSHYKFKQRLKQKAFEYGKLVVDVGEAYTSKTNNFTGEINENLGGKEYIIYDKKRIDRDINGALGILLKALGDTPCLDFNELNCTC